MACSNIRYGPGVTQEVGMDLANLKAKKVGVYTDKTVATLPAMKTTLESLNKANVNFKVNLRIDQVFKNSTHFLIYQRFTMILKWSRRTKALTKPQILPKKKSLMLFWQ